MDLSLNYLFENVKLNKGCDFTKHDLCLFYWLTVSEQFIINNYRMFVTSYCYN